MSFDSRDGHEEGGFSVVAPGIYRAIADFVDEDCGSVRWVCVLWSSEFF